MCISKIKYLLIIQRLPANLGLAASSSHGHIHSAIGDPLLCLLPAALTHFFWLATFGWMVGEGLTMYNQTVRALKSYGKKDKNYTLKLSCAIYGKIKCNGLSLLYLLGLKWVNLLHLN